jgi:hypothetical protein
MKTNPSKRKQMQAKLLSFTSVYVSESGVFNELQPIQIKKFAPFFWARREML